MRIQLSTLLALAALAPAAGARADEPKAPAQSPEAVRDALEKVAKAPAAERRLAALHLAAIGPAALPQTRKARDEARDPELRATLAAAARWLLASKLTPVLAERAGSGLQFDGQYSDLKGEGPEAVEALLALLDDEETPGGVRIAAARALADVAGPEVLPRLRAMEADPLFPRVLQEETGTLMAIFGDTRRVESAIARLSETVEGKGLARGERLTQDSYEAYQRRLRDNLRLAEIYYRIRKYKPAVECYERAIAILEGFVRQGRSLRDLFGPELAQTCYNAACSLSLGDEVERAKEMLRKAVEMDPAHLKNLDRDGDLRRVRESPGYAEFKRSLEKPLEKKSL